MKTLAVDAINIRAGGGLTHLQNLFLNFDFDKSEFDLIIVYGCNTVLNQIPFHIKLRKIHRSFFESTGFSLFFWYAFVFPKELINNKVNLLFVPGGHFLHSFKPTVLMSQNMLPIELKEASRYGFSKTFFRLLALRVLTVFSVQRSSGIIFLSLYALDRFKSLGIVNPDKESKQKSIIIPHGVDRRFDLLVKPDEFRQDFNYEMPMKIIYVSIIDVYKHHDVVSMAAEKLLNRGIYIELNFVGPFYNSAKRKLDHTISRYCKKSRNRIIFHNKLNVDEQISLYKEMDLILFASSCENLPIILIEGMRTGLPIVCSNRGPMNELIDGSAITFNPESVDSICHAIEHMYKSKVTRQEFAIKSYQKGIKYNWDECSSETFSFLKFILDKECIKV
jgi:glycosyltransferase involved in cell wall biosynthesis